MNTIARWISHALSEIVDFFETIGTGPSIVLVLLLSFVVLIATSISTSKPDKQAVSNCETKCYPYILSQVQEKKCICDTTRIIKD